MIRNILFQVWCDDQLDKVENELYLERVLLPEALIKVYMDFYFISKTEAESRISNVSPVPLPPLNIGECPL